jgi:hypothetical protein
MSEIRKKAMRLALIAGAMALMLIFSGCAQNAPAASGEPADTEQAVLPTAIPTITASPSPSPSPTPSPIPTVVPTPTPTPVSVSLPPIPENFIVKDEYWEFAFFVHASDGNPSNGGIIFSGFPEGMKLYAPMSGYLTLYSGDSPQPFAVVYLSESADDVIKWDKFGPTTGGYITFHAREIELLEVESKDGALYVEKGKPFAEVTKKAEMWPDEYEKKPELMVLLDMGWREMLDVSTKDPREFMWSAIQILEEGPGN